ncbi:MAG: metallophosphoesterase [Carboxylicivirga sp.]|jgi:3',5'-cyclic AMP phosphodiesterase CpdA|nr:metallophosphoesterase [Carboxylicivirga sp.]
MKRRDFVKNISMLAGGVALSYPVLANTNGKGTIKFGISTDIHNDIIHDGEERLTQYLTEMKTQKVDFVIDLGDFCHPVKESVKFAEIWKASPLEKYNVLGNHDMDLGTKNDFMHFVGMEKRYYSFDKGDFHFIVLDPNNLHIDGSYIPYANANFYKPGEQRAHVDPEQLEWLKSDLAGTDKVCIVFSHQSFENKGACQNQNKVRAIFEKANEEAGFKKVVAAFSGHDHTDYAREINGIHYVQINSMSYKWVGNKYKYPERFSKEINKKRPNIDKTIPYKDPLFACVTIGAGKIIVYGVKSSFIKPGPQELGMDLSGRSEPFTAEISDRKLKYEQR